jgi:hypothetical protein
MSKSYAEDMADSMGEAGMGDDDGSELDSGDQDASGVDAMKELIKHLKSGDAESAWECFKNAQSIADESEDKEEDDHGMGDDDMPPPKGHSALLLMPHGR